jgi:hypothetical protein
MNVNMEFRYLLKIAAPNHPSQSHLASWLARGLQDGCTQERVLDRSQPAQQQPEERKAAGPPTTIIAARDAWTSDYGSNGKARIHEHARHEAAFVHNGVEDGSQIGQRSHEASCPP